jgi:hypothetical protein
MVYNDVQSILDSIHISIKSTCPTQFFSCPIFLYKNDKNQQTIISNLCKIFWLLSHKHYLILSLLIDIMIMTSWIQSILYDYFLDGTAIRETNLEIED